MAARARAAAGSRPRMEPHPRRSPIRRPPGPPHPCWRSHTTFRAVAARAQVRWARRAVALCKRTVPNPTHPCRTARRVLCGGTRRAFSHVRFRRWLRPEGWAQGGPRRWRRIRGRPRRRAGRRFAGRRPLRRVAEAVQLVQRRHAAQAEARAVPTHAVACTDSGLLPLDPCWRSGRFEAHVWVGATGKQVYLVRAGHVLARCDAFDKRRWYPAVSPTQGGYEQEEHAAEAYDVVSLKCKGTAKAKLNVRCERRKVDNTCAASPDIDAPRGTASIASSRNGARSTLLVVAGRCRVVRWEAKRSVFIHWFFRVGQRP